MTMRMIAGLMSLVLLSGSAQADIEKEFGNPPESARPHTWYHWINGNVSREGITKDLESFKKIGLRGFTLFDVSWYTPHGGVVFNSDAFHSAVSYTIAEADRLGLKMGMNNGPGWSSTGVSWVTPAQSMKRLVWTERRVGPGQRDIQLDLLHGITMMKEVNSLRRD